MIIYARKIVIIGNISLLLFSGCGKIDDSENVALQNVVIAENEGVTIDATSFPDSCFRSYVEDNFDKDFDGRLSEEEIVSVEDIFIEGDYVGNEYDCRYKDLESVKGIEFFTELKDFRVFNCSLRSVDFSNNTKITKIVLMGESVQDINISHNRALEELTCFGASLSKIDISHNKELRDVDLTGNKISKLDISNNIKLEKLNCKNNDINEIDIQNNLELHSLDISGTNISEIELSSANKLEFFECIGTDISELDLSNNSELLSIYCQGTDITVLDLSNNPKTYEVECDESVVIVGEEQLTLLERF
jgi:hypothetical protein